MRRQTPIQLIANKLPNDHPLKCPIPQRTRLPLDSPPSQLLTHLDHEQGWRALHIPLPSFPPDYPPALPPIYDPDLMCTAFTPKENKVLEWIGDAVVELAVSEGAHRNDSATMKGLEALTAYSFLGHLALLYGMQLYDTDRRRRMFPEMRVVSNVVEAVTGAAVQTCGVTATMQWLTTLLSPWLMMLCPKPPMMHATPKEPQRTYQRNQGLHLELAAPSQWLQELLPGFSSLDVSRIILPPSYPPMLSNAHAHLAEALADGVVNSRLRILGRSLYRLSVSVLCASQLPTASATEMNIVRIGLSHQAFGSRLGLLYDVQNHLRHQLIVPNAHQWHVAPSQTQVAFLAVAGSLYSQEGGSTISLIINTMNYSILRMGLYPTLAGSSALPVDSPHSAWQLYPMPAGTQTT
ncbi:hypothetical protein C8F01DRAFT_1148438 [Mycena amicta]|nr:hypothetical protein C8F01DRAFT_1148438 [Mycena amicta]